MNEARWFAGQLRAMAPAVTPPVSHYYEKAADLLITQADGLDGLLIAARGASLLIRGIRELAGMPAGQSLVLERLEAAIKAAEGVSS
jgi:hypothetical protein